MISEKEIFERLMNGENLDDIMNEITTSVNNALEAKKKADAEAEEAKRKAEAAAKAEAEERARRDAAMFNLDAIINGLCGLLVVYGYTDEATNLAQITEEEKEDLLESIDSMMELGKAVMMLNGTTFPLGGSKPKVENKSDATEAKLIAKQKKTMIDPFEEFFKKWGI